ncbi:MAG: efflux RND transporter permease subunit [Acidobacteria bacterium]|nr:efflux RND transporter permease subunit [Acidobacteriota bacterium]
MSLPEFSIQRPVTVLMACMVALLLGGIAFVEIPVDLMPETEYPTLTVTAQYPGVAPEEMETLVARPIEEAVASAPGVEEITSTSNEGQASVRVKFAYGADLDEAANELRVRLDRNRGRLPDDLEPPMLLKFDSAQFPIMFITVRGEDMDPKELRHFAEKNIQYRLERAPGVAQARVSGGLRRQIHVDLDLKKLRALNLSVADVVARLRNENQNRPVGPVQEGRYEVLLRTQGEFENLEDILAVGVATRRGIPVYLRDIATVEDSYEEIRYIVRVNGDPAVRMFIYKQSGSNTVEVSDGIWKEAEDIQLDYPGVKLEATWDSATFIRASIHNVQTSAVVGAGLAIVVLLFFLGSFSSTLVIGVAIPISVIATFALMFFNGFTLNTVSFGGLALGVGMLVDNSIVVLENIFRHREEGLSMKEAALLGSDEVAMAITASTMTTIAVFVPVLFIGGMSAETFKQLAYVVSFALICSLLVSITVVPVLCAKLLRASNAGEGKRTGVAGALLRFQDWMSDVYASILDTALNHRFVILSAAFALCAGAVYIIPLIGVELEPQVDEGQIEISLELEPGTRVEVTDDVMQRMSSVIREEAPESLYIMTEAGSNSSFYYRGTNTGRVRVDLVPASERTRSASEVANALREKMQLEPGMLVQTKVSSGTFRRRGGDEERLQVEVRGHDPEVMGDLAEQVHAAMLTVPGIPSAVVSRRPGTPEMLVRVDRAKATSMGLSVNAVADTLETAIGGSRASMFREEGDEYDILVRLREQDRLSVGQVGDVPVYLPDGTTVPAQTLVRLARQEGPVEIRRKDQQRIVVVGGTVGDRDMGSIVADLREKLRDINRPRGYEFVFAGEWEEQEEAFRDMTFAAILALLLVYMVMAAQFESLRDPFIILFSIPLAAIGVVLMLLLTGTTFNMQGFLGVIVLVGIVVNNAIVLIDYTNLLIRDHGMGVREAVVTAGRRRLRPILMTTATTVLGLLPMSLGIGEGGELQAPLARVVIGGLTTSTLITLVIIPIIYYTLEGRAERSRRRAESSAADLQPAPSGD